MSKNSPQHFDFLVIGGGSAGYAAARVARETVDRVAIVDGSEELGGLCILRGCMPSKTLIYTAEVLHLAHKAETFGLKIPEAAADMQAVLARKRRKVAEFQEYREGQLLSDRFTLLRDHATFTGPNRVRLQSSGEEITSDKIVIATGSVANQPPIPGLQDVQVLTSDDILELDFLPKSMIVLGAGVVACELAQYLSRMGTRVTIIQRSPHILSSLPAEAAEVVEQALRDEGIELFTGTKIEEIRAIEGKPDAARVRFQCGDELIEREAEHLFNALGRTPNTHSLDLGQAGVELAPTGHVVTNQQMQSTHPAIYAAGDCAGPHEIVHIAIVQGETAARHATGRSASGPHYDQLMSVVFTDPQIGLVGLSEQAAKERGIEVVTASATFDDHGKSITMDAMYGYVKLVADRSTGRLIGAEVVGKEAAELIHAMTYPVASRALVSEVVQADWYHPTLSEIWTYPLEDIVEALLEG